VDVSKYWPRARSLRSHPCVQHAVRTHDLQMVPMHQRRHLILLVAVPTRLAAPTHPLLWGLLLTLRLAPSPSPLLFLATLLLHRVCMSHSLLHHSRASLWRLSRCLLQRMICPVPLPVLILSSFNNNTRAQSTGVLPWMHCRKTMKISLVRWGGGTDENRRR
jgi:hypothetical protein